MCTGLNPLVAHLVAYPELRTPGAMLHKEARAAAVSHALPFQATHASWAYGGACVARMPTSSTCKHRHARKFARTRADKHASVYLPLRIIPTCACTQTQHACMHGRTRTHTELPPCRDTTDACMHGRTCTHAELPPCGDTTDACMHGRARTHTELPPCGELDADAGAHCGGHRA